MEWAAGNRTAAAPPHASWAWGAADGALMLLIVGGNTLTILAVTTSRRLSSLASNQLVLNLAISDLMVGLTLPYHLVFYFDDGFGRLKWSCLMRFILIILSCLASIYNIIAIAIDRYIAIVHPLHYGRYMTKTATRLLMGATWSVAMCVSCVPIFWNEWADGVACEMNVVVPRAYTTSILTPMFSLVWIAMFVLYWRIWREAACHARRLRARACCSGAANDWKSIQVVLLVLGSFSICWMPFVVVACTQTLPAGRPHSPVAYRLTSSLAMANSGVNPLIYAWKNAGFRAAFSKLLRCKRPDSNEYRDSPTAERQRGSVALREGSIHRSTPPASLAGRRTVRLSLAERDNDAARCRVIENAGYVDGETGACEPWTTPRGPTASGPAPAGAAVHGPATL